jgi:hypothetical protein
MISTQITKPRIDYLYYSDCIMILVVGVPFFLLVLSGAERLGPRYNLQE